MGFQQTDLPICRKTLMCVCVCVLSICTTYVLHSLPTYDLNAVHLTHGTYLFIMLSGLSFLSNVAYHLFLHRLPFHAKVNKVDNKSLERGSSISSPSPLSYTLSYHCLNLLGLWIYYIFKNVDFGLTI